MKWITVFITRIGETQSLHLNLLIRMSEEYLQLVKVTTCMADGEECAQGRLLRSISTMCKQEYLDLKLVVLSEELVVDTFSFPSCCSCVFNNILELRNTKRNTKKNKLVQGNSKMSERIYNRELTFCN